ncbi:MAG: DcrB-related protein [Deltaproteobacteria bacterium]|nr:DcrB-related protein [Deltaproteobacteria bacterium]
MRYRWRDLAFDVADDLDDRTVVVLSRQGAGPAPSFTLVVSSDKTPQGMAGYVDEALREQLTSLSGFRVASRKNSTVMGSAAVVVDAVTLSPEGVSLVQKQAFVDRGGSVVVVTGSCRDATEPRALLEAAFQRLLSSLVVEKS